MLVVKHILGLIAHGTEVVYITGNHDEMLRKFDGFKMESFQIVNKFVLKIDGKRIWMFHGDVFDFTMRYSKWLAKLGGFSYDLLIKVNRAINLLLEYFGREKISLSKKIKHGVKSAVSYINNFEDSIAEIAISKKYDAVICGHIHQPEIRTITSEKGSVEYMNPGDWIENLTGLEYNNGRWTIYKYENDLIAQGIKVGEEEYKNLNNSLIFSHLLDEMNIHSS
jgi:UDP-2,3-diacylglucosamine pyrophosphatase LpxH